MEATGIGWAGWIGAFAAVLACIIALIAWLAPSRRDIANDITNDPTYRRDLAADVAGTSLGQHYHHRLEGGLALLDRTFGPPSSAAALGTCIIIALIYAFAGFFLVWGAGGPGAILSLPMLPTDTDQPARLALTLLFIVLPAGFFCLGRWFGPLIRRFERRLISRLQHAQRQPGQRPSRRSAELGYGFVLAVAFMVLVITPAVAPSEKTVFAWELGLVLGAWPVLGVVVGIRVWPILRSDWTRALASATAGAAVVAFAVAVAFAIAFTFIGATAAGVAGSGAVYVAVAGAVAVAVACTLALTGAVVSANAVAGGTAVAFAVAGAGAFALNVAGASTDDFSVAGAVAGAVAVAVAVAVAGTLAFTGAVAGAVAVAFAVAFANAVGGAVAVAIAVAVGFAVALLWKPGAFPGAIGAMLGLAGIWATTFGGLINEFVLIILIFFLVLPLINGVVDWFSWWVTRWLGAHLLWSFGPGATARRVSGLAIAHGVADLLLAALMLLAMAFTLAFGFEVYNQASLLHGGRPAFDLETFVAKAAAAPFADGAWLTLMLLTTLVPTFLHVAVVCMSPLGFLFLSARRHEWARNLEAWDTLDEPTQSRTRRAVAAWMAHGRILLWLLAGLMALGLFALIATAIALLHDGGFADYVADAAFLGINLARWLAGN